MSDGKSPEELQEAFVQAAKIADAVPEAYRAVAFQRALDALLAPPPGARAPAPQTADGGTSDGKPRAPRPAARNGGARARGSDVVDRLIAALNRTELAELMAGRKVLDRALLVLRAAQHHEIDEMSAQEISEVLTRKFRERTKRNAVHMAMERSPSYTDRREREGTVVYALMGPGERYLDSLSQADDASREGEGAPPRPRPRAGAAKRVKEPPRRRRTSASERANSGGAAPEAGTDGSAPAASVSKAPRNGGPPRRSSGKPGPKALLEDLLAKGLFDSPQTLGSIIEFVEHKRGHRYKATDFSPSLTRLLRENKLDRDRNADGQYEYRKHGGA